MGRFTKKSTLNTLSSELKNMASSFFDASKIEAIGKKTGLIKRKCKLTAYHFLLTLMFSRLDADKQALTDFCAELHKEFGYLLTKQALHERFTAEAVEFLKTVIAQSIEDKMAKVGTIAFLDRFSAVRIQDSTSFQIPAHLKEFYGGCGGSASGALARIQLEYDMKHMSINTLELTSGTYQDVSFSQDHVSSIQENELVIRDLGYISGAFLQNVSKQNAFFVNRLKGKQKVYIKNKQGEFEALSFSWLLKKMKGCKLRSMELDIYLEVEGEYCPMRLIAEKMPDEIYEQRIRKAEKEAKKKNRQISDEYRVRTWLNLFVTNLEQDVISTKDIGYLYSLRWQIELIFKTWKSIYKMDKTKKMKKERFECQLYAKLLLVILSWKVFTIINNFVRVTKANKVPKAPVVLSYYKINKLIAHRLESFMKAIVEGEEELEKFVLSLAQTATLKVQLIEPKNKTLSSIHIFERIRESADNE